MNQAISGSCGQYGPGVAHGIAAAFLAAVAKGETPDDLLESMVDSVLGRTDVRLALAVREGGPHAWRGAIELAGIIARGCSGEGRSADDGSAQ